jgi:signal transduction histidine kinase
MDSRIDPAAALLARAREQLQGALAPSDPRLAAATAAIDQALAALQGTAGSAPDPHADAGRIGFLSTVCHDLKDPLAAVMMGSAFLLRAERGDDPARTLRMAEAIQRAGARMSSLLQNLTDFVHLTTGRRHLEHQDVALDPLVERAFEKTRAQAAALNVDLAYARTGLQARGDADAIVLALQHLLANAVRYSPPTSTVKVTATRGDGPGGDARERIVVRVIDQGSGISAERFPHLFDPYWNARQRARDGVGLGLGIVTAIALAHGRPPAATTAPTGTTLTLVLPEATSPGVSA